MGPTPPAPALCLALLLLVPSCFAAPYPYDSYPLSDSRPPTSSQWLGQLPPLQSASIGGQQDHQYGHRETSQNNEPFVVLASGRRLPYSAHRRLINLLQRRAPVSVQLPSGQALPFADCDEFLRKAPTSHLDGGQFVIPSESWPVDIAQEALETERAQRVVVELPSGSAVPYHDYVRSAPDADWHHRGPNSYYPEQKPDTHPPCSLNDIPDENLFIMLGNGQRLLYKVHEAIHCHYSRKLPFDVRLASGEREKVLSYEEVLKKLLDPRFMGCSVRLSPDVSVPIETYRAVVDAHRLNNVFVEYPDGHRVPYPEHVKQRDMEKKESVFRDIAKQEQLDQDGGPGCCGPLPTRRPSRRRTDFSRSRS